MIKFCDFYSEKGDETLYLHHLATDKQYKGVGKYILLKIQEFAKKNSKKYIKLDNIATNKKLNEYYEKNGFKQIGILPPEQYDGKNPGILRMLEVN